MSGADSSYAWDAVAPLAGALAGLLAPLADRVQVVGSVSRGAAQISDFELLVIDNSTAAARAKLDDLRTRGALRLRLNVKQRAIGWGYWNRFADVKDWRPDGSGAWIPCDFFFCTPQQWAILALVRTGPVEFSRALMTQQSGGGLLPDGYQVENWQIKTRGGALVAGLDTETAVFRFLGCPYLAPHQRDVGTVRAYQRMGFRALFDAAQDHRLAFHLDGSVRVSGRAVQVPRLVESVLRQRLAQPQGAAAAQWAVCAPQDRIWRSGGTQPTGYTLTDFIDWSRRQAGGVP